MSKTKPKSFKNFVNGFDDTHHNTKKYKELKFKKTQKQIDNAFRSKDLNKILTIEETI